MLSIPNVALAYLIVRNFYNNLYKKYAGSQKKASF